jgi:hypothetical protein
MKERKQVLFFYGFTLGLTWYKYDRTPQSLNTSYYLELFFWFPSHCHKCFIHQAKKNVARDAPWLLPNQDICMVTTDVAPERPNEERVDADCLGTPSYCHLHSQLYQSTP